MAGEAVPEVGVGVRSRGLGRWLPAMVVALGFTAFAPACLAQVPVASNPTPVSFGSQAVGSAQAQTTVTFTVTTGGTLDATPLVLTTGAPDLDYTMGTGSTCAGPVGGTCTVNVVFTPRAPGQRLGAVVLTSDGATVATALLNGTGTGPAVVFPGNRTILTLGSGLINPSGVAVDGAGNV
jgi:large repetitive protein